MDDTRSIFIADDHPQIVDSLTMVLEFAGHHVRSAPNGTAALQLILSDPPTVAILDLDMPGLTGIEVTIALRLALGELAPLLIALTGNGDFHVRERCLRAGFDEVCFKPITAPVLLRTVREVQRARHPGTTAERAAVFWPHPSGYAPA